MIIDTNFINFSIKNKLDIVQSMMDCLYAKCELIRGCGFSSLKVFVGVPCVSECVMAELEKLGTKFRIAQRLIYI